MATERYRISRGTFILSLHNDFCIRKLGLKSFYASLLASQANEVLQGFLQSQAATEKSILQADKALTDAQKALAGTGANSAHRRVGRFL